jgi:TnpA family transposase
LFSEAIDWSKIQSHWQDILQVVLSIKMGKVSSAVLLRKLGNYSRKNRLYQAFQELGRVIRTVFLLQYISDLMTSHVKRFGDYLIDMETVPNILDDAEALVWT